MRSNKEVVNFINSVVGEGARFSGDLRLDGLVRIDGDFIGTISYANKVVVGKTGRVKSSIFARSVVIAGSVFGDIQSSDTIEMLSTALVVGNISTPLLLVEEGAIFHGLCEVISPIVQEVLESDSVVNAHTPSFAIDWHGSNSMPGRNKMTKSRIKT